jgi:Ca2+-binding EF-hand superfamily protein
MAQYKPSFVDLSGMSQGIAQGMQQAMQIKQQTDSMVEQRLNEFEKNYNPTKLRAQDLPAFTTAFQNYKQSALRYSRLNRGGAKPEEIAVANELKDRSLNEMNDLYSKSSMANQFLAERNDYRRMMAQRGYETPEEVNAQIMQLTTSPANEIDFKSLASPYDINLKPNTRDLATVSAAFKNLQKSLEEDVEETQDFDVPGFGKAKVRVMARYKKADIDDALNVARMQLTNSRISNYIKDDYEELIQGFNLPDDVADPQLAVIRKKAVDKIQDIVSNTGIKLNSIEDITPELLLAYNMGALSRQRVGYRTDRDELNAAFKAQGIKMSQERLNQMVKNNTNIQNNRLFGQAMQAEKFGYKKQQDKNKGGGFGALLRAKREGKK